VGFDHSFSFQRFFFHLFFSLLGCWGFCLEREHNCFVTIGLDFICCFAIHGLKLAEKEACFIYFIDLLNPSDTATDFFVNLFFVGFVVQN
jgi:hypothetical protein